MFVAEAPLLFQSSVNNPDGKPSQMVSQWTVENGDRHAYGMNEWHGQSLKNHKEV